MSTPGRTTEASVAELALPAVTKRNTTVEQCQQMCVSDKNCNGFVHMANPDAFDKG